MKKLLLILGLLLLLTACESPVVNTTPGDPAVEKVFAPHPFYIADLSMDEDGGYLLTQSLVTMLSEEEATCVNSTDEDDVKLKCNPNGFLIVEGDAQLQTVIPAETPVYISNIPRGAHPEEGRGTDVITFEQLIARFEINPDFFAVTPFELEYGTVTVDGQEMTDQITAIKEIYIP